VIHCHSWQYGYLCEISTKTSKLNEDWVSTQALMETNQKLLQRSLSSMKGADFLHLPVAVMHAANSSNVWYVQAKASSLGDVTWKNDSELIWFISHCVKFGFCMSVVTNIFCSVTHMLPISSSIAQDAWEHDLQVEPACVHDFDGNLATKLCWLGVQVSCLIACRLWYVKIETASLLQTKGTVEAEELMSASGVAVQSAVA
jgi:hypothetical protein